MTDFETLVHTHAKEGSSHEAVVSVLSIHHVTKALISATSQMVNTTMSTYIMISDTMDAMSLLAAGARQGQVAA